MLHLAQTMTTLIHWYITVLQPIHDWQLLN